MHTFMFGISPGFSLGRLAISCLLSACLAVGVEFVTPAAKATGRGIIITFHDMP